MPFEYQEKLRDHLKSRKKTWDWFRNNTNKKKQEEEYKSALLKNTYRLDRDTHPTLYVTTMDICKALSIDAEVTIYQENNSMHMNAGISIIDKEAHIVISGNVINLLERDEMKALLAHELSHYLFYKMEDGDFKTTSDIILALANNTSSNNSTIETARVYRLYMELFCDAGSLTVCGDYKPVIQMLVKMNTGIKDVNADSYLQQAKEILSGEEKTSQNETHPDSYVRALALQMRAEKSKNYSSKIIMFIEGSLDIDRLDIFEQKIVSELTFDIVQWILKPSWMNSSLVFNLALRYFNDFTKSTNPKSIKELNKVVANAKSNIKNYLSFVLLDFAKADSDLEGAPIAYTLEIAELLEMESEYEKIIRKELKLSVRDFKTFRKGVTKELMEMRENKKDSLYDH